MRSSTIWISAPPEDGILQMQVGVAIVTLRDLRADPSGITTATEKITAHNRTHFGVALNEDNYPATAERKKFARAIIGWTSVERAH